MVPAIHDDVEEGLVVAEERQELAVTELAPEAEAACGTTRVRGGRWKAGGGKREMGEEAG